MRPVKYIDDCDVENEAFLMAEDLNFKFGLIFLPTLGLITIGARTSINKFKYCKDNMIWLSERDVKQLMQ